MFRRFESLTRRPPMASLVLAGALAAAVVLAGLPVRADMLRATDDAFLSFNKKQLKKKYGGSGSLTVSDGKSTRHAYLRFDISDLPAASTIEQAALKLYVKKVAQPGDIDVYLIEDPWDEDTIRGKDALTLVTLLTTISVDATDLRDFVTIPLTDELQDWIDGLAPNYGIALVPNPAAPARVTFDSKEDKTTGHQPALEAVPALEGREFSVPGGAVMAFNLASCPAGWSELVAARGRTVVGLPSGGALAGTLGTGLGDLEDRAHSHMVDAPSTATTTVAGHSHDVDPPAATTSSDTHNHAWGYFTANEEWYSYDAAGAPTLMIDQGFNPKGNGTYPIALDSTSGSTRTFHTDNNTHDHTVDLAAATSTVSGGHGHDVDLPAVASDTAGTSAVMPYIQLLYCEKS